VHVVQRVFRHESSVVRLWPYLSGQGDGRARCVSTHRASGRPARQRRIDHAGSNCAVAEFGDLRANSRCILGARPAPHQKALSGARHRQPDRRNGTDFADGDFLVACHHGSCIGSRYEALTSRRALSTSSASLSSMRMTLRSATSSPCRYDHHHQLHDHGNELAWWANVQIDASKVAKELWASTELQAGGAAPSTATRTGSALEGSLTPAFRQIEADEPKGDQKHRCQHGCRLRRKLWSGAKRRTNRCSQSLR
jgi:hypothetical protein